MFSGIVEACAEVLQTKNLDSQQGGVWLSLRKPEVFQDLKPGDSVAVNGVCLTVCEDYEAEGAWIPFILGAETLKLLGAPKIGEKVNLERSLRFGDRVHGHLVTGHVDSKALVKSSEPLGVSWLLRIQVPSILSWALWKKGSVAIHGVSLTVNEVHSMATGDVEIDLCLIPETLNRTNLGLLRAGDLVHIEVDAMARAFYRMFEKSLGSRDSFAETFGGTSPWEVLRGEHVEI